MEADEHRLRSQRKGVPNNVMAAGKVEHPMRVDGLLDCGGIVAGAVAFHAECVYIDPFAAGRQGADCRRKGSGHRSQRNSFILHTDGAHLAFTGNDESVTKGLDLIEGALSGNGLTAFA